MTKPALLLAIALGVTVTLAITLGITTPPDGAELRPETDQLRLACGSDDQSTAKFSTPTRRFSMAHSTTRWPRLHPTRGMAGARTSPPG
jgi:hypothetical protein